MVGKIKLLLSKNYFLKSFLALISGTVLAQLINLAFYPIIARIYGPAEFGTIAFFSSVLAVCTSFTSGKYELAIPTVKQDNKARNLVNIALLTSFAFAVLAALITLVCWIFFREKLERLFTVSYIAWIVPYSIILINAYTIFTYYNVKNRKLNLIFRTKLYQVVSKNTLQVGGGLLFTKFKVFFLLLGVLFSQSTGVISFVRDYFKSDQTRKNHPNASTSYLWKKKIKLYAGYIKKYKKYPIFLIPSNLLSKLGLELPVFFFTLYYSVGFTGYYSMALQLISIPTTIIIQSLSQTYLNEFSKKFNDSRESAFKFYKYFNKKLIVLTLAPCAIAFFIIEPVIIFLLGDKWAVTAELMKYLCILAYFQLIYSTISQTLNVINKHEVQLYWNLIRVVALGVLFFISNNLNIHEIASFQLYALIVIIFYLLLGWLTHFHLSRSIKPVDE